MSRSKSPPPIPPACAPAHPRRGAQRGLTLIEVLTTTAISAILLSVAAPSFVEVLQRDRARSEALELWALLNRARAEAVRRNVPVLVCPSVDGVSCLSSPAAGSWAGPKIVCFDNDADGACDPSTDAAPNPVQVRNATDPSVRLSGPSSVLRFNGHGTAAGRASFSVNGGSVSHESRTIVVTAFGAVRLE